ncbi:GNAT family N-acetyltransferase [Deinococcus sp.]|uniref:GNAT family N-acetyltransferase n=1 Tax=Deinococcus sp. TaxID=47478 RepID=UPI002869D730|nr:GNAT family N-acetyltransferase [Deinococcus sp.]
MTLSATALRAVNRDDIADFHAVMMDAGMDARSSWMRTLPADLERSLFSPGSGGFLALSGAEPVGCVGYRPDGSDTLTLNKLATRPGARGIGLGRALGWQVEHVARAGGYGRVLLAVSQFNLEVVSFYEKLGYVVSNDLYAHANPSSPPPVVLVKAICAPQIGAEGSSPQSEDATQ